MDFLFNFTKTAWFFIPAKHIVVPGIGILGLAFALFKVYQLKLAFDRAERRKRWAALGENVVVLHQLVRSPVAPSPSPFPIKLETYLRMAKLPYVVDHSEPFGPKGKTPWITLNGQDIGDSQLCIELLGAKFGKDFSSHLTEEQKAIARSLQIMADEHLFWPLVLWRFIYSEGQTLPQVMPFAVPRLAMLQKRWRTAAFNQGIGRHTEAEVMEMATKDLIAMSALLGNKPFFMGDKPVEADCALFGMLAQVVWGMPGGPLEELINEKLTNLKEFCERMKATYWPDWDQILVPPKA